MINETVVEWEINLGKSFNDMVYNMPADRDEVRETEDKTFVESGRLYGDDSRYDEMRDNELSGQ